MDAIGQEATKFWRNLTLGSSVKWHLAYGALLHFLRSRDINLKDDIDICVYHTDTSPAREMFDAVKSSGKVIVRTSAKGEPLHYTVVVDKISFDFFRMIEHGEYFYHVATPIDQVGEIPKHYTLKGIKKTYCNMPPAAIQAYRNSGVDNPYDLLPTGVWNEKIPQTDLCVHIPYFAGRLMDVWYPRWWLPQPDFGQSRAQNILQLNSLEGIL